MILNPIISEQIRIEHDRLAEAGEVLPEEQLASYYRLFREKFGPERLAHLDGEILLNVMHNSSDPDSMVYWLELKNDEEFPNRFGSIAGGSPLKFGLFRHRETGLWTTGTPQKQVSLSVEQAVEIAYKHRNQLLKGCELLGDLPLNAGNEQYAKLDKDLNEQAPGISNVSWAHKYFSLLFPDKLEDYHSPDYQRFHLIKMLQIPVAPEGRYTVAGQYMAIARELGMHINNLTRALNEINGKPYQYWVVDIRSAKSLTQWDDMLETGYLGIGWDKLGNLSYIKRSNAPSNQVKSLMLDHYKQDARFARDIFSFVTKFRVGDIVVAIDLKERLDFALGIGRIQGEYLYLAGDVSHRRAVEWLTTESLRLDASWANNRAVCELLSPKNILAIESSLLVENTTLVSGGEPRLVSVENDAPAVLQDNVATERAAPELEIGASEQLSEQSEDVMSVLSPPTDVPDKKYRPFSRWNPFNALRLLWLLIINPTLLKKYQEECGENAIQSVGMRLSYSLTFLPVAMIALGAGVGMHPPDSSNIGAFFWGIVAVVLWLFTVLRADWLEGSGGMKDFMGLAIIAIAFVTTFGLTASVVGSARFILVFVIMFLAMFSMPLTVVESVMGKMPGGVVWVVIIGTLAFLGYPIFSNVSASIVGDILRAISIEIVAESVSFLTYLGIFVSFLLVMGIISTVVGAFTHIIGGQIDNGKSLPWYLILMVGSWFLLVFLSLGGLAWLETGVWPTPVLPF